MEKISKTFGSQISSLSEKHLKVSKRKENFYESSIVANLDDENEFLESFSFDLISTSFITLLTAALIM